MILHTRQDLLVYPRGNGPDASWIIKDPISFNFFVFTSAEKYLLELFDGKRSIPEIRQAWQAKFRSESLTDAQVQEMGQRFVHDGLVRVNKLGDGWRLNRDEQRARRQKLVSRFSSPIVIKFGGIDPREILQLLWLPGRIFFHPVVMLFNLTFSFLVFAYFLGHFEEIFTRTLTMSGFFDAKNMILLVAVIAAVKVVHELGHAVACQRFGGECFEIGILLLAFFPTLYCDVSDSWTFQSRWKRMIVAFAGIYVEILIATIAAIVWLATDTGLVNTLCFNLTVMCSLNTVLINGNPLLRYDGYYILSDLVDQPFLSQDARAAVGQATSKLFFDQVDDAPSSFWLTFFGAASVAYRWFVMLSISFGIFLLLRTFEFGHLSEMVAGLLLASIMMTTILASRRQPRTKRNINLLRTFSVSGLFALLLACGFLIPLPSSIRCNFTVQAEQSLTVFSTIDGVLDLKVQEDDLVVSNQTVATVDNPDLAFQIEQIKKRLKNLEDRVQNVESQPEQGYQEIVQGQLLRSEIQNAEARLEVLLGEQRALTLASPISGTVRAIPINVSESLDAQLQGTLFDAEHRHCYVRRGQPLMSVEGAKKTLVSIMGEQDIEFIDVGQQATVVFHQIPNRRFYATVEEIVESAAALNPTQTEMSGLETFQDQQGNTQTIQAPYRVILSIENLGPHAFVGSTGRAKIDVAPRTLANKIWFMIHRWWKENDL